MLETRIASEGVGGNANAVSRMFAVWTKRQREVSEQAHITLTTGMRPRHRVSICHQPVVVRLAEKIAPQQLKSVKTDSSASNGRRAFSKCVSLRRYGKIVRIRTNKPPRKPVRVQLAVAKTSFVF